MAEIAPEACRRGARPLRPIVTQNTLPLGAAFLLSCSLTVPTAPTTGLPVPRTVLFILAAVIPWQFRRADNGQGPAIRAELGRGGADRQVVGVRVVDERGQDR